MHRQTLALLLTGWVLLAGCEQPCKAGQKRYGAKCVQYPFPDGGSGTIDGGSDEGGVVPRADAGAREYAIATEGEPCAPPGARACAEHNDTATLVCLGGIWLRSDDCDADQRCDSRAGQATRGACTSIAPLCLSAAPGDDVCDGELRRTCGVDLVDYADHACPTGLVCRDDGKVRCDCPIGSAVGIGDGCVDLDECSDGTATCHRDADCTNEPGTFSCRCRSGFHGDGIEVCEANALCTSGGANCDTHATCEAVGGASVCVCGPGFEGDGEECVDIDECARNLDSCDDSPDACVGSLGGYSCSCPFGFVGSGKGPGGCTRVADCSPNPCKNGGTCAAAANNSFACECPSVATGDLCESDRKECDADNGGCGAGFQCIENAFAAPSCPDLNECAGANVCGSYGCVNHPEGAHYHCRGQFPEWSLVVEPSQRFAATNTTATDARTGLQWQRVLSVETRAWVDAVAYCANLSLDGEAWRLPSRVELLSIADPSRLDPSIDAAVFPGTPSELFWTSSSFAFTPGSKWGVSFANRFTYAASPDSKHPVRCVRGGLSGI